MDHLLIKNIEQALDWPGPVGIGEFALGTLPDPALCARLMTPQRLLDVLRRGALGLPQLRCLRDGIDLHPNTFTSTVESRRGREVAVVDMRGVGQLLGEGVTLVADAVNAVDPTLEIACRAMRWWSHELVGVNAYLTTGAAAGFPMHWDDHDVIVVQVAGSKAWEVRGCSRPAPMFRDAAPNDEQPENVLWKGWLEAGQVMHIPRGYWHQATRADQDQHGHSLHLTFGFTRRTGVDWLSWVADQSRKEELFRRDLPREAEPAQWDKHTERLATAAAQLVTSWSPARMLAEIELTRSAARHVTTGGAFGPPEAVVAVTEFRPDVRILDDEVVVEAAGKQLRCAREALPALRTLLSGHPVVLDRAAAATGVNVHALAAKLVEVELCAEMTEALWSGCTGLVPTADC